MAAEGTPIALFDAEISEIQGELEQRRSSSPMQPPGQAQDNLVIFDHAAEPEHEPAAERMPHGEVRCLALISHPRARWQHISQRPCTSECGIGAAGLGNPAASHRRATAAGAWQPAADAAAAPVGLDHTGGRRGQPNGRPYLLRQHSYERVALGAARDPGATTPAACRSCAWCVAATGPSLIPPLIPVRHVSKTTQRGG
jgi:hypothetical protein